MKKIKIVSLLLCWISFIGTANANLLPYDFNFDTGVGFVTGTFTADFDNGNDVPVDSFSIDFGGVTFDMGTLLGRIASGATDFTGLSSTLSGGITLTSSLVTGATLDLNTCGAVACQAIWNGIPGLSNGSIVNTQSGAVSRTSVPEPSTLAIFALGMIGFASRRFKKQS